MSLTNIRSQIKIVLDSVSGIGSTYDYKKFSNQWESYKDLFVKNSRVNTWEVQRNAFEISTKGSQARQGKVKGSIHSMVIRGFYSFVDNPSSEKEIDTLIDSITDALMENQDLNGSVEIINVPITGTISFGFLGEVFCHIVEIDLNVQERTFL